MGSIIDILTKQVEKVRKYGGKVTKIVMPTEVIINGTEIELELSQDCPKDQIYFLSTTNVVCEDFWKELEDA